MPSLTRSSLATLLASLALLALPVSADEPFSPALHFDSVEHLLTARLDPIVNPGEASQHAHRIFGGSNFAANYNFNNSRESECTSVYAKADKSNYWTPQVYWTKLDSTSTSSQQTYTPIRATARFYYFLNNALGSVNPFPEGLRIVPGNAAAKDYASTGFPDQAMTYTCQKSTTDNSANPMGQTWQDFDTYCPSVKLELKFPSCWDGKTLFSEDNSHVVVNPSQVMYGGCPVSHQVRIPAVMLELTWFVEDYADNQPPKNRMILANGDTTGFGTHADISNGWDSDVLKRVLSNPKCVTGKAIAAEECPELNIKSYESGRDEAKACKPAFGTTDEPGMTDGVAVPKLPGCNPPWASGDKPTCDGTVEQPDISAFMGKVTQPYEATSSDLIHIHQSNVLSDTSTTWQDVGCVSDAVFGVDKTLWESRKSMSVKNCQDFCGGLGLPYSGTELGYQCWCSGYMQMNSTIWGADKCDKTCSGDSSAKCGSDGLLSATYKPTVQATLPNANDKSALGCYVDKTVDSVKSPDWADVDSCRSFCKGKSQKYFAVGNSKYCSCSNDLAKPKGWESRVPDLQCNAKCSINSAQTCGGNVDGMIYQSVYLVDGEYQLPSNRIASVSSTSNDAPASTAAGGNDAPTPVGGKSDSYGQATSVASSAAASTSVTDGPSPVVHNAIAANADNKPFGPLAAVSPTLPANNMYAAVQDEPVYDKTVTTTIYVTATVPAENHKRFEKRRARYHF